MLVVFHSPGAIRFCIVPAQLLHCHANQRMEFLQTNIEKVD